MYRWYVSLLTLLFLPGCAVINGEYLSEAQPQVGTRGENAGKPPATPPDTAPYELQRQALFDQPYIDPLTDYLKEHGDDTGREAVLRQIAEERDRRCQVIADGYAGKPATEQRLARYRAGYNYSCPAEVESFAQRVQENLRNNLPATIAAPDDNDEASQPQRQDAQSLSDCYLLTTIRNFSAAREACRETAENGDPRSQVNMAMITHAFEDYASAFQWARQVALVSGTAAYILAQLYDSGLGVEQNPEQAVYWYDKAASQGHKEARIALERFREQTPADGT